MSFNASKAQAAFVTSAKTAVTKVDIREAFEVDDRFMRIVATASAGATKEQVFEGIRQQFKGITPIPGSFMTLATDAAKHVFEGIVGVVSERVVYNDNNRGKFKAVAANMYMMDGEAESLWALRKTATGEVMVKAVGTDDLHIMQNLLACASTDHNDFNNKNLHLQSAQDRAMVQGGDLIFYVSQQSCDMQMAFAAASVDNHDGSPTADIMVVRPNGQKEMVHREMIVCTAGANHMEEEDHKESSEVVATAAAADVDRFQAFYSRVFARRPAYFQAFMDRVRSYVFF